MIQTKKSNAHSITLCFKIRSVGARVAPRRCLILLTVKCIITIPLNQPDCQCSNYCLRGALFNFCGTTTVQLRQPKCSVGNEQGVQTPAKYLEVVVLSLLETSAVQERISNTGWIIDHAFEINYMVILYVILFKSNLDVSKACF